VHAADAGADDDADPVAVLLGHVETGIRDGLLRGDEAEMGVAVVAARLLGIHQLVHIPVADLRADLAGEGSRGRRA
jgi:hypothetical protein